MEISKAVALLGALAQESRLVVFRLLVQAGPAGLAAGRISQEAGIPPSSLSFHLRELLHAGMVSSRHEGRFVIYSANYQAAQDLVDFLARNCCESSPCNCQGFGCDTPSRGRSNAEKVEESCQARRG